MIRRSLLCITVAALSGCIPTTSSTTTSTAESTVATSAAPTTVAAEAAAPGGEVELSQFGFRFAIPAPLYETPTDDYDFRAVSDTPRGLFTVLECAECDLNPAVRGEEVHTLDEIDGVPMLIIENAELDLPAGVSSNELVVVDQQRSFSVIMSYEGDLQPIWQAFLDSIEFVAPSAPPTGSDAPTSSPSTPSLNLSFDGRTVTLVDYGISFDKPEGFEDDADLSADDGYGAYRKTQGEAAIFVLPCPLCDPADITDGEAPAAAEIDGQPAVVVESTVEGSPTNVLLILTEGREVLFTMAGTSIDTAWQELLDSITIAP